MSGLTAIPVSTALVTRRSFISPASSTSHSTTVAMKLANDICAATPRPQRGRQRRAPSRLLAHEIERRLQVVASCRGGLRRKAIESLPALRASSSMKLSMANTLLFGPTPRQKPVMMPGGSSRLNSTRIVGDVVGDVLGGIDAVRIHAFLEEGGQKARHHGRAGHSVLPADDSAALKARPKDVAVGRPINVVSDVFLAGPYHLDRPVDVLGDSRGTVRHVGFELAAEAATQ